jgi:hypothetical protein
MQQLLESEGIEVVDNQIMILIIILANHQWVSCNPSFYFTVF